MICHDAIYSTTCPVLIKELFTLRIDITDRETRAHELDLYYATPKHVNTVRKPSIAGAMFWNGLPDHIKSIVSLKPFKRELKKYLIEKY